MSDTISRQAAIDALNGIINRFEQILRDIRESKVDDSVCGMCEYDGAFVGQSGDWCNECPGFEKDDCFRLSDECRKRWLESVELPAAQPEKRTNKRTETHACDLISRQAAIDAAKAYWYKPDIAGAIEQLPSAQPEQRWIPCSERLPEEGERVLATHLGGLNPNRQVIEHIYQSGQFTLGWDMDMDMKSPTFGKRQMGKVIAWMPWPEPARMEDI